MPDFSILPECGTFSVEQALEAAERQITRPCYGIMIASTVVGFIAPFLGAHWLFVPSSLVAGVTISITYSRWITPRWRIWAYSGVRDIHQLQRSAELAAILPKQSYMDEYGIMDYEQLVQLRILQQRFTEENDLFQDDASVPPVTEIYEDHLFNVGRDKTAIIIIDKEGITTADYGFFEWSAVCNEQVVFKSFSSDCYGHRHSGTSGGKVAYLTFYVTDEYIAYPLTVLDIKPEQLDLLLYIYRGRYNQKRAARSAAQH